MLSFAVPNSMSGVILYQKEFSTVSKFAFLRCTDGRVS